MSLSSGRQLYQPYRMAVCFEPTPPVGKRFQSQAVLLTVSSLGLPALLPGLHVCSPVLSFAFVLFLMSVFLHSKPPLLILGLLCHGRSLCGRCCLWIAYEGEDIKPDGRSLFVEGCPEPGKGRAVQDPEGMDKGTSGNEGDREIKTLSKPCSRLWKEK